MNSYPYGSDGSSSDEENDSGGFDVLGCKQLVQSLLKHQHIPRGQSVASYARLLEEQFMHQCFTVDQSELDEYKVVTPAQKRKLQEAKWISQNRKRHDIALKNIAKRANKYAPIHCFKGKKATHNINNLTSKARKEIESLKLLIKNRCGYTPSYMDDSPKPKMEDVIKNIEFLINELTNAYKKSFNPRFKKDVCKELYKYHKKATMIYTNLVHTSSQRNTKSDCFAKSQYHKSKAALFNQLMK